MNLSEAKAHSLGILFDTAAEARTVTYDDGTTRKDISAVVNFNVPGEAFPADHAVISVRESDVPSPQYRDVFIIDGEPWRVCRDPNKGRVAKKAGGAWEIRISAKEGFKSWT